MNAFLTHVRDRDDNQRLDLFLPDQALRSFINAPLDSGK